MPVSGLFQWQFAFKQSLTRCFPDVQEAVQLFSPDLRGLWWSLLPVFCWLMNDEQALCEWSCAVECHLLLMSFSYACVFLKPDKYTSCFVCTFTVCVIEWHSLCRCTTWPQRSCTASQAPNLSKFSADLILWATPAICKHKCCCTRARYVCFSAVFACKVSHTYRLPPHRLRTLYAQTDRRRLFSVFPVK